ncbi:MAG TPA: helix-turn-helix transcriptional regulator [Pyrinomonadaceae bacterium]|jgi:transcriptional regulator with XRE-family HTH domain
MGTKARHRPERLAEKLVQIRLALGLSQNAMLKHLEADEELTQNVFSNYELGKREPPLILLLRYARAANVYLEAIVDDSLDLPDKLPSPTKSEGIRRKSPARSQTKR